MRRRPLQLFIAALCALSTASAYNAPPTTQWWPFRAQKSSACSSSGGRRKQQHCAAATKPQFKGSHLRGGTITASLSLPAIQPEVMQSSLRAVSELLTCCGFGWLVTRVGLIEATTTRALAKCVFNVFLPAMLCTSVASTVASGAGLSLLPLPLAAWLQVGLALAIVSLIIGPRTIANSPGGRDVAALSSFGNSGVLPLIFADCLFRAQPVLHARANALVAMFLLGWSPLFWTLGFSLLSSKGSPDGEGVGGGTAAATAEGEPNKWEKLFRRVLTPPIIGCLAGILVGSIPPLRSLLVPPYTVLPIHRCLETFGKAYSPAALLVLASSLALPAPSKTAPDQVAQDTTGTAVGLETRTVRDLGVVMSVRFLLLPLCFSAILTLTNRLKLLPPDPLRDFLLIMQSCMPSAQNAVLALQVANEPARATRMARLLLVIYLAAAVPVSVVLSVALQQSGLLAVAAL